MEESLLVLDEKTEDGGAWLRCFVPDFQRIERYFTNGMTTTRLDILDNRLRSKEQLRKYWALVGDIEFYTGYPSSMLHDTFKATYSELKGIDPTGITLSTIDMTSLREIIDSLLEFCMTYDVPLRHDTGLLFKEDIKYLYYLLKRRLCFICGHKGEWHHITGSRVGMGHNRNKINNVGREFLCLCGKHHSEIHNKGETEFIKKHHLQPIKLTEEQVKELGL
jgi:Putative HNHc nuclease